MEEGRVENRYSGKLSIIPGKVLIRFYACYFLDFEKVKWDSITFMYSCYSLNFFKNK